MGDLAQVLTQQLALERDMAEPDAYGAETAPDWQPLVTVPCRFWWWTETSRGPARESATTERTVATGDGGMVIESGPDVTTDDRVANVLDKSGNVIQAGPFEIAAVLAQETHTEIFVRRP